MLQSNKASSTMQPLGEGTAWQGDRKSSCSDTAIVETGKCRGYTRESAHGDLFSVIFQVTSQE